VSSAPSARRPPADDPARPSPADDYDDVPLPDLPPLPEDPRWRIEHLPMLTAIAGALTMCAASAGFLVSGLDAALGAAAGVLLVTVSFTVSTLVVAWADTVRPALVMPLGLLTYVIKYTLIVAIMIGVASSGWSGGNPMALGIAVGAVLLTAAQVWWVSRLARRNAAASPATRSPGAS
jgi:hypothetical protein